MTKQQVIDRIFDVICNQHIKFHYENCHHSETTHVKNLLQENMEWVRDTIIRCLDTISEIPGEVVDFTKPNKMKKPKLNDIFLWKGELAKVVGLVQQPSIIVELMDEDVCPHCKGKLSKEQFSIIPDSPLFQESAEPIQTLTT